MERTDREELEVLRSCVARVAQALNTESKSLPVLGKGFKELVELAKQDRGWNNLCALMCETIQENREYLKYTLETLNRQVENGGPYL